MSNTDILEEKIKELERALIKRGLEKSSLQISHNKLLEATLGLLERIKTLEAELEEHREEPRRNPCIPKKVYKKTSFLTIKYVFL